MGEFYSIIIKENNILFEEIKIEEFECYKNDDQLKRMEKRFNVLNTIRRNLRSVSVVLNHLICYRSNILKELESGKIYKPDTVFEINQVSFHGCIVLYARWFGSTNGKTTLSIGEFLKEKTHLQVHHSVIELRDKCVVHNELDILGGDMTSVVKNSDGSISQVISDYNILPFPQKTDFNMILISDIVEIIHDKINNVYIPKLEESMIERIQLIEKDG